MSGKVGAAVCDDAGVAKVACSSQHMGANITTECLPLPGALHGPRAWAALLVREVINDSGWYCGGIVQ
jgi:hypothetical protein